MSNFIEANSSIIILLIALVSIFEFTMIIFLIRRIKRFESVMSWLLLFERLVSLVFNKQIKDYIEKNAKEVNHETKKSDVYEMHKSNVSSSPITSR